MANLCPKTKIKRSLRDFTGYALIGDFFIVIFIDFFLIIHEIIIEIKNISRKKSINLIRISKNSKIILTVIYLLLDLAGHRLARSIRSGSGNGGYGHDRHST